MRALIGKKIGMTQVYTVDGICYPVTVVVVGPNVVIQKKSALGKDGYTAVKLGFGGAHKHEKEGTEPRWRMTKALAGVFQKVGIETPRLVVKEISVTEQELDRYEVGKELGASEFKEGQYVDVIGTSKGCGFTGVMKRHNFGGARSESHGTHEYFRHAGSIGASADPSRVIKGMRMAGQYGNARITVQNLHIVDVLPEQNAILIKGGIPGPNGATVIVRTAVKRPNRTRRTGMKESLQALDN